MGYGGKVEPRNLNRSFEWIREKAGLHHQTPHRARHACASLLGELGVDARTVMEILSHTKMPMAVEITRRPGARRGVGRCCDWSAKSVVSDCWRQSGRIGPITSMSYRP
jgi:hypothetical protein